MGSYIVTSSVPLVSHKQWGQLTDMTAFTEFWDIASFRDAFTSLIMLPESSIQVLRSSLDQGGLPSGPPEGSGISVEDWRRSRSTVRTLAAIRDDDGFAELISDIGQVLRESPDNERALVMIRQLLELDPNTEQLNLIRRTQDAALPVLINLTAEIDFRAVPSVSGGEPTLAPVYVVRLTFDEDIAGSSAIVFQVPEDATDIVVRRLEEARELRTSIAKKLPKCTPPRSDPTGDSREWLSSTS
jgi:hypothetical protein